MCESNFNNIVNKVKHQSENVHLQRATIEDAEQIWRMQIESFAELLSKYQDMDTNPGNEPLQKVINRLKQPSTYFYFIYLGEEVVGAIRVFIMEDRIEKKISPLFILPVYNNRGIAQRAILEVERIHGSTNWILDTCLQEEKNCHLYEKMGYQKTGKTEIINDKLTLVLYAK